MGIWRDYNLERLEFDESNVTKDYYPCQSCIDKICRDGNYKYIYHPVPCEEWWHGKISRQIGV